MNWEHTNRKYRIMDAMAMAMFALGVVVMTVGLTLMAVGFGEHDWEDKMSEIEVRMLWHDCASGVSPGLVQDRCGVSPSK